MQINYFQREDKIDKMIKQKIMIIDPKNFNQQKNCRQLSTQQQQIQTKNSKRLTKKQINNDIVIMNMPTSSKEDIQQNFQFYRQTTSKIIQSKVPFFANSQIFMGIKRFQSTSMNRSYLNKQNIGQNNAADFQQLKRYNSMNVRNSSSGAIDKMNLLKLSRNATKNAINQIAQNQKIYAPILQFKPSFRELISRKNSKMHQKIQIKLKKSQINYQRAIKTSSLSRKEAFQKILTAFQQKNIKKQIQNPELNKQKYQRAIKMLLDKSNASRQLQRVKTGNKSPEQRLTKIKRQEQTCRPWSAGKRNLVKLQATEEQNPLQFYPIN